ncbi:MAG: hypothetical protein CMJ42_07990 [Phyllobacteriaceae bacterium]|nr:hypothetical protein [Phyllobacteriaceae bacterium]
MEAETIDQERISTGNVTFDPLARAIAVENPAIAEVLDLDTGEFVGSNEFITAHRYEEIITARHTIRSRLSEKPAFACALCATPVYLVSNQFKHFFFRHICEDGSCPAQTHGELSRTQISRPARKRGAQENQGADRSQPCRRSAILRSEKRKTVALEAGPEISQTT